MQHPAFVSGDFDTHFVSKYFNQESLKSEDEQEAMIAAVSAVLLLQKKTSVAVHTSESGSAPSNWVKNRIKY